MAQIVKLKRSLTAGSKPTTSNLSVGELAINVNDGRVFLRKSGSAVGDNVKEFVTLDHQGTLTGSLNISGSISGSFFTGSFVGDGSQLTGITVAQTATVRSTFTSQTSVTVDHNLNTTSPIIQVYDNSNYQIIPASIQLTNANRATVTFDIATTGYVVVAKGGHLVSGSISADSISGFDAKVKTKLNAEGVFSSSAQVTLGGDLSGTANAAVISEVDGGGI